MLDWTNIDTVLLDMDGTLLDLHFDNFFWREHLPQHYADLNAIDKEEAYHLLHSHFASEVGSLQWYCLDHWSEQLQVDVAALKREVKHRVTLRPHSADFLKRLAESDREVLLVTNAHRDTLAIKMEEIDITGWFDRIVVSHDFGHPKESQRFWQQLQALHPFVPERTLLIDDTESILDAAQTFGIAHLLTMLQPDSQEPVRGASHHRGIVHFDEIMPPATST